MSLFLKQPLFEAFDSFFHLYVSLTHLLHLGEERLLFHLDLRQLLLQLVALLADPLELFPVRLVFDPLLR